ncbi:MAG: FIST C-terminal domain-containing protein [Candidatus Latescibacteria bacterium]|nr:FIST C-terminal domain-containing protein [Candidatus Latescibacterota bacterium]
MQWTSAVSSEPDLDHALDALERELKPAFGNGPADLAVVFVSPHHQEDYRRIPAQVQQRFGPRVLIGCSAAGVIGGGREFEQQPALSLTLASLPGVQLRPFQLIDRDLPDLDAGPQQWIDLIGAAPQPPVHFLLLADPATFDPRTLLMGLDFAYPGGAKIGGLASAPQGNALFLGQATLDDGAVGLALGGNIAVDTVVAQGCRPIGQPMTITRCEEHFLLELDHRPAVEVLVELYHRLEPEDQELLNHGLQLGIASSELQQDFAHGDFLIRNVMRIGRDPDFIAIGDHLRQGQTVQFHLRDARTAAEDLALMLQRYHTRPASTPLAGALLFTCTGRGQYLFERPNHDSDMFRQQVGALPLAGFFCGGEIGQVGAATYLHGYTSSFGIFRPLHA